MDENQQRAHNTLGRLAVGAPDALQRELKLSRRFFILLLTFLGQRTSARASPALVRGLVSAVSAICKEHTSPASAGCEGKRRDICLLSARSSLFSFLTGRLPPTPSTTFRCKATARRRPQWRQDQARRRRWKQLWAYVNGSKIF